MKMHTVKLLLHIPLPPSYFILHRAEKSSTLVTFNLINLLIGKCTLIVLCLPPPHLIRQCNCQYSHKVQFLYPYIQTMKPAKVVEQNQCNLIYCNFTTSVMRNINYAKTNTNVFKLCKQTCVYAYMLTKQIGQKLPNIGHRSKHYKCVVLVVFYQPNGYYM